MFLNKLKKILESIMEYGIWATRSAKSVFGAASAWVKINGKVWRTHDEETAKFEAKRLNASSASRNVHYELKEYVL